MVDADARRTSEAIGIARALLVEAQRDETPAERRRRRRLGRLLSDPHGRELVVELTDRVLRIESRSAQGRAFADVVRRNRTPVLGPVDQLALSLGALAVRVVPSVVMPLVERRIRAETEGVVLPADEPAFTRYLAARHERGIDLIVNPLGEAILSDAEADRRMAALLRLIDRDDVDEVSVKISAIVANLDVIAFDVSVERIADRLRTLYRAAGGHTLVTLDMEEYRDLDLTLTAFERVLGEDEFASTAAGIVLQAYLPDAHGAARRLGELAIARRCAHPDSGRIRIRVVKGANLAMEQVEAELHGWIPAPYPSKPDVDASYKALLEQVLEPRLAGVVDVGVGSHNLFDVAWALRVADDVDASGRMRIEMLEGMAPAQARAVAARAPALRLYAPVVERADFDAATAYLSRRLDENTQPANFLRALFDLEPDSSEFDAQAARFRTAVGARHTVTDARRRAPCPVGPSTAFANAADTDFTVPAARDAVWSAIAGHHAPSVTPTTSTDAIDAVLTSAAAGSAEPATCEERASWLEAAAELMDAERATTIAAMVHETAKIPAEADPEVSEAIDFCRYYARDGIARLRAAGAEGAVVTGRGVVAVVAPWNFPYAIPAGGVAAALAAGNAVVLKPAPEAVEVGALLADQFWRAGVPRSRLHLVVCDDGEVGRHLVTHHLVDTIVLTGSLATASSFLDWRPHRRLLGETSGKNAIVVAATADLDEAIADLVRSAFGHAGQKCSAASLAIVERSVHDGSDFLPRLRDAVASIRVGPASEPGTMMGPLIGPPGEALQRGLTQLDAGERWLVEPRRLSGPDDPQPLWTPGVRTGVEPGSWFHRTECFGPVLGVIRVADLDEAVDVQNGTPYGLTGGIHALDPRQVERWLARVEVGNAYVNRHITGAVVRRQPFGGWKRSRVGGGAKAGGPGYVLQLARCHDRPQPHHELVERARQSYRRAWDAEFAREHDPSGLRAESNVLRYRPLRTVAVRHDGSDDTGLALLRVAAEVSGVSLVESDRREEDDASFATRARLVDRVRALCSLSDEVRRICHRHDVPVDEDRPVSVGEVELRRWVDEQAISRTMHRHGRPIPR